MPAPAPDRSGAGNHPLQHRGSGNTIVLPAAGQGCDNVFGHVLRNGDEPDLRSALSHAGWYGDPSALGNDLRSG